LVLAAALEGRRFEWTSSLPTGLKVANVLGLLWLAAGETGALVVLAEGQATALAFGLTTGALVTAGELVIITAVLGRWAEG